MTLLHVLALFLVSVQGIGRSDFVAFHKGIPFQASGDAKMQIIHPWHCMC